MTTTNPQDDASKLFSREGIVVAALLLAAEYNLSSFYYAYADSPKDSIPPKYYLYMELLIGIAIILYIVFRANGTPELKTPRVGLKELQSNFLTAAGLSLFGTGTFILYNLLWANAYRYQAIYPFINSNNLVQSTDDPFMLINQVLFPVVVTVVFQGFLLNGLAKDVGFRKANLASSLFYGFWFGDMIGFTAYCLFMNQLYWQSKNILYPAAISVVLNLIFALMYFLWPEFWMLPADYPQYNSTAIRGFAFAIAMSPVAWLVIRKAASQGQEIQPESA